jgi:flagellar hook-associated protein 1 FlgK
MPDILKTGLSGLLAFQRALATTGHNIANVNTDGYSRQVTDLATRTPQGYGNGFIGNGVDVVTVRRMFDQFAVQNLRTATSNSGLADSVATFASQIDDILGDPNTGIATGLQDFFNAWQDVANNPASIPARQVLLSQAQALANRFSQASTRLDDVANGLNNNIRATTGQINSLASSLASINQDILRVSGAAGGQPPNDLLDKRDAIITQLAKLTNVTTTQESDGAINVFIGNGQPLVLRDVAVKLQVAPSANDPSKLDVFYAGTSGNTLITNQLSGGELGGYFQVREQMLDPARNQLGLVAVGLAQSVNAQQAAGLDLQGQLGQALFSIAGPQILPRSTNTGSGVVTATVSDIAGLTGGEYDLRYNGAAFSLVRTSDGSSVTMTGAGTAANPFVADGISIVVTGAAAAGDVFRIQPTRLGAQSIQAVLTDPRSIAAAGPIRTAAGNANLGGATISGGEVLDASNANLLTPVTIQFLTANTYSVNGAGSFAYASGGNIDVNGWRVQITGTPTVGDNFTVQANTGGVGDNRNALLVAGLQSQPLLAGGTTSLSGAFGALVGSVGTQAQQAGVNRDAQAAIASQANQNVLAVSGVNLDEEAADLVKWQQAYQAAAQTIAVANTVFDSLLAAVRR